MRHRGAPWDWISSTEIGEALADLTAAAAAVVLPLWRTGIEVSAKADKSPVTEADRRGEALILEGLARRFPGVPVISEEHASEFGTPEAIGPRFFLVDPVDGTKAFVRGDPHFTVNIGLIEHGCPGGRRGGRAGQRRALAHLRRGRAEAARRRSVRRRSGRGRGRPARRWR